MTIFHNFALIIKTDGAAGCQNLMEHGTCLIRCKQITITWGKMSQPM